MFLVGVIYTDFTDFSVLYLDYSLYVRFSSNFHLPSTSLAEILKAAL